MADILYSQAFVNCIILINPISFLCFKIIAINTTGYGYCIHTKHSLVAGPSGLPKQQYEYCRTYGHLGPDAIFREGKNFRAPSGFFFLAYLCLTGKRVRSCILGPGPEFEVGHPPLALS